MKNYSYILCFLYLVMLPISIFSVDDFMLGTWDWRPSEYFPDHMQEGINRLTDAHYNTASASFDENFWGTYDTQDKYEASLGALRNHNLGTIFSDFMLNPYWRDSTPAHAADFGKVSLYSLTNTNYLRLEAEYNDDSSLNPNDANNDVFFYRFKRDTPTSDVLTTAIPQTGVASNHWAFQYDPLSYPSDDWVTILDRMCFRWETTDTDINNELFQFSKISAHDNPAGEYLYDNAYLNNDSLYISISMIWDEYRDLSHDFMKVIFYDMATGT